MNDGKTGETHIILGFFIHAIEANITTSYSRDSNAIKLKVK